MDEAFPEIRTPALAMVNCPPPRKGTVSPG